MRLREILSRFVKKIFNISVEVTVTRDLAKDQAKPEPENSSYDGYDIAGHWMEIPDDINIVIDMLTTENDKHYINIDTLLAIFSLTAAASNNKTIRGLLHNLMAWLKKAQITHTELLEKKRGQAKQ